jgi:2'-5' RNA ligase
MVAHLIERLTEKHFEQSALVLPVLPVDPLARPYRKQYTIDGAMGLPAHITILFPFFDQQAWTADNQARLEATAAGIEPFEYQIVGFNRFVEKGVLYLEPDNQEMLLSLIHAIATLFPELAPYEGRVALDQLIPHISIAFAESGVELDRIETEFRRDIDVSLPWTIKADQIWLVVTSNGQWYRRARIGLGPSGCNERV